MPRTVAGADFSPRPNPVDQPSLENAHYLLHNQFTLNLREVMRNKISFPADSIMPILQIQGTSGSGIISLWISKWP